MPFEEKNISFMFISLYLIKRVWYSTDMLLPCQVHHRYQYNWQVRSQLSIHVYMSLWQLKVAVSLIATAELQPTTQLPPVIWVSSHCSAYQGNLHSLIQWVAEPTGLVLCSSSLHSFHWVYINTGCLLAELNSAHWTLQHNGQTK